MNEEEKVKALNENGETQLQKPCEKMLASGKEPDFAGFHEELDETDLHSSSVDRFLSLTNCNNLKVTIIKHAYYHFEGVPVPLSPGSKHQWPM